MFERKSTVKLDQDKKKFLNKNAEPASNTVKNPFAKNEPTPPVATAPKPAPVAVVTPKVEEKKVFPPPKVEEKKVFPPPNVTEPVKVTPPTLSKPEPTGKVMNAFEKMLADKKAA